MEQKILRDCYRFGMPIPEKIQNAPELLPGLELYHQAFLDLNSCRALSEVMGPIPILAMLEYCWIHEIDGEQREDFLWLLQRLDLKFMQRSNKPNGHGGIQPTDPS